MKKLFVQWQAAREIKSEEKVGVRKASEMPLSHPAFPLICLSFSAWPFCGEAIGSPIN